MDELEIRQTYTASFLFQFLLENRTQNILFVSEDKINLGYSWPQFLVSSGDEKFTIYKKEHLFVNRLNDNGKAWYSMSDNRTTLYYIKSA